MFSLIILSIIFMVSYGKDNILISPQVLEKEIGINWWNILNADTTCCPLNTDETSCNAEAGSDCKFLKPNNPIAIEAGSQCVGVAYIQCKKAGGITACCTPKCNPPPPDTPSAPAPPGPGKTPAVCGPAPIVTPSPTTPAPVTPRPTTPAPVTPGPTTPAPVTPRPTTPAPVTPAPTTPAPVTPQPTPRPTTPAPTTPAPTTPAPTTPAPTTPAPTTPAPTTPAPTTPAPTTPAPTTPAPTTPAPTTPSPTTPSPTTPAPTTPAPTTPAPTTPAPTTPAPTTPAPTTPAPTTPAPTTPAPTTPAPTTPAPTTPAPTTPAPTTPAPTTPAPTTPAPTQPVNCVSAWGQCGGNGYTGATCCITGYECIMQSEWYSQCKPCADPNNCNSGGNGGGETPAPVTPSPTTPSPTTPAPVTPAPVTPSPVNEGGGETPSPVTPAPVTPSPTTEGGGGGGNNNYPTRSPVIDTDECEHLTNYAFEGVPCQISGDPHFFLWNGAVHDFMGQPSIELDDKPMDQFYYVTQCAGSSSQMMPFRIIGRQYNLWPIVSGLDYLVFELFEDGDDSGVTYYLFLSPDFQAYARKGHNGVSTYYDDIPSGSLNTITPGSGKITIGTRFMVTITETGTAYNAVDLKLEIGHGANSYTNQISISCQSKDTTRCRQTYANLRIDPYYKCRACGLCGDFVTGKIEGDVKQAMKACDGQTLEFGYGSDASKTPEAFDPYGWTYERNYWLNTCELYNNGNNTGGFKYVSPCDDTNSAFISAVKQACIDRTHIWADCCREVSEECVNLQKDCNWDTCVMSTVEGMGDMTLIDDSAIEAFDNAMEKLCNLPPGIYDSNNVDPYGNCKLQYEQCGGSGYSGETCCKQGFACFGTSWPPSACTAGDSWCACGEDPSQTSGCSSAWQQCGGKEWTGPTCCNHGYVCIWDTDYYSQCLPVQNAKNKKIKKSNNNDLLFIDSMNNILFNTNNGDIDYIKIGGITFGILSILIIINLYYKKQQQDKLNDGDRYIAIDDQQYETNKIPNYQSVV